MKRHVTQFILAALLLVPMSMKAQFVATIEDEPRTGWCEGPTVTFSFSEVCKVLECETDELDMALYEWGEEAKRIAANTKPKPRTDWSNCYPVNDLFQLLDPKTGETQSYTFHSEQYGGFEMDKDGYFASWDAGSSWGVFIQYEGWSIEEDYINFTVCQNPSNALKNGDVCHGLVAIGFNDHLATFDLTLKMKRESIDKEPVTNLDELTIVGESTYEATQYLKEGDDNRYAYEEVDWFYLNTNVIAPALGIDGEYMMKMFSDMIFVKSWDTTADYWGPLTNEGKAVPSPGFYFGGGVKMINEETGEEYEVDECINSDAFQANAKFFVCNMRYYWDTGNQSEWLRFGIGQALGGMQAGETAKGDMYIIYGDKAWVVHFIMNIPDNTPITTLTKVGEETWTIIDRDPRKSWNETESYDLDLDAIAQKFTDAAGADVAPSDFVLTASTDAGGVTTNYTADYDAETGLCGFWMDEANCAQSYNNGCYYINYFPQDSRLALGNKPNYFNGGEQLTGSVYFVVGDSLYYEVKVELGIMAPQYTVETCEVTDYDWTVQLVPTTNGVWQAGTTEMQNIEMMIDLTGDGKLYGVDAEGNLTNAYSVGEANNGATGGGFWMSPDDETGYTYSASYSGTGSFAMWYYQGTTTWFTVPDFRQPGQESHAVFYIYNFWEGKAVKLNTTLKFVDHIIDIRPIGEEDLTAEARNETGEDLDEVELDLTAACEALGCTEEELLEQGTWMVMDADGYLTEATEQNFDDVQGFYFDANGRSVNSIDDAVFTLGVVDQVMLHSMIMDEENLGNTYTTTLYLSYKEKLYAFNVTVGDSEATAISSIKAVAKSGAIYNIAGQQLAAPQRGLNIIGGKKVLVK